MELRRINESDHAALLKAYHSICKSDPQTSFLFYFDLNNDFKDYVQIMKNVELGVDLPQGHVPGTFFIVWVDDKVIGRVSIRHELNEFLLKVGGHIGYLVVKKYRNKGYATEMLRQALLYCKDELMLKKVLVTCDDNNIGSIKTIEKNEGILEEKYTDPQSEVITRRYWIDLT